MYREKSASLRKYLYYDPSLVEFSRTVELRKAVRRIKHGTWRGTLRLKHRREK